jgi:hypothetical protein
MSTFSSPYTRITRMNHYFWLAGYDGLPRYAFPATAADTLVGAGWLPEGRILAFSQHKTNLQERNGVEEIGLDGRCIKGFSTPFSPTQWSILPDGSLEFIADSRVSGQPYFFICDREGKVLRKYDGPSRLRQVDRTQQWKVPISIRNGHTLAYDTNSSNNHRSSHLTEKDKNGVIVWETCSDCGQPYLVFPLVRFGFTSAAEAPMDNLANRVRQLPTAAPPMTTGHAYNGA